MKTTKVTVVLLFVSFFLLSVNSSAQTMTIDGSFADWNGVAAYVTDAGGDNGGANKDLTAGYYAVDATTLYLKTDVAGTFLPIDFTDYYIIYFDTDRSTGTGYTAGWWSMGADYRIIINSSYAYLQTFADSNQSNDTWSGNTSITFSYSGSSCELAVAFAVLGVTSSNSIWLQWRAEPGTDAMPGFSDVRTDAPLPVELTSFTAVVNKNSVELKWHTATEVNNYGFEVERIRNYELGIRNWEKIGFVNGNGNSNSSKDYSFVDKTNSKGKYAYRLKQIDNDGKYKYSKEVEVDLGTPKEFLLAQNYPNPFNPSTVINYQLPVNSNVTLKVFNALGKEVAELVNEKKEPGTYSVDFSGANLSSGAYFYRLQAGNFIQTKKFILMK